MASIFKSITRWVVVLWSFGGSLLWAGPDGHESFQVTLSGPSDVALSTFWPPRCLFGCSFSASVSGGTPPFTWVFTGSASSSSTTSVTQARTITKTFNAVQQGAQWISVEVTDRDGREASDRLNVTVHKKVELKNLTFEKEFERSIYGGGTNNLNSEVEGTFVYTRDKKTNLQVGVTVSGGVDLEVVKAEGGFESSGSVEHTVTSALTVTVPPRVYYQLWIDCGVTVEEGTATIWSCCDGEEAEGTYENRPREGHYDEFRPITTR